MFVAAILGVLVMYITVNMETRAKMKSSSLQVSVSIGLIVTVFQQLKVFSLMSFYWPEPFRSLLRFSAIFGFDLEVVKFACILDVSPAVNFSMKLVNVAVLLVAILIIHVCFSLTPLARLLGNKQSCKDNIHYLTNTWGTLFFAFATAIASLSFTPFACLSHPNNEVRTVQGYPTVVCWNSDEHTAMVSVGILATLILLICVSLCGLAIYNFNSSMRLGNTYFLQMYAFLFSRFRVGAQYWGIVCLLRGLVVAIMPVFPNVLAQCVLMLCLLIYSTITVYVLPWRLLSSNALDVGVSTCLIMVLALALFFAETPNLTLVSTFCVALFSIALTLVGIVLVSCVIKHCICKQKRFQFFLCHHKGGCGAFARMLKTHLVENPRVSGCVFLDSDDLQDLNKLFQFVREELDNLVVLCTREIMMRPWCVGEMVTARLNKVPVVMVKFPDFSFPDDNLINNYSREVPGCAGLAPHGISEAMVQETMRWVSTNPTLVLPPSINMKVLDTLAEHLLGSKREGVLTITDEMPQHSKEKCQAVILVDTSYSEAISTAFTLEKLLLKFCGGDAEKTPRVLSAADDVPVGATKVLIVCSNGCFANAILIKQILQASQNGSYMLPIVSEDAFRFPTEEFWDGIRNDFSSIMGQIGMDDITCDMLIDVIKGIFAEIAVAFHACDNSAADLKVRAATVARRIQNKTVTSSKSLKAIRENQDGQKFQETTDTPMDEQM